MKQSLFVVFITLAVVGFTEELSLAQCAPETVELSTVSQAISLTQGPVLSQSPAKQSLVMAQNTTQKELNKKEKDPLKKEKDPSDKTHETKPAQPTTPTSDRTAHYQCLEYCVVVRQSCESLASIQPDAKIARIGSEENSKWSHGCQNVYDGCMKKCDFDEKEVHWKKAKFERSNIEKKR